MPPDPDLKPVANVLPTSPGVPPPPSGRKVITPLDPALQSPVAPPVPVQPPAPAATQPQIPTPTPSASPTVSMQAGPPAPVQSAGSPILPGLAGGTAPQAFVGSFDAPPGQPGQPTAAAPAGNATVQIKQRKRLVKPLLFSLLALLVLGGASAAAYFGIIVPNKPANVLRTAVINSLKETETSTEGTIGDNAGAFKVNFSTAENNAAKAADLKLNLTYSGVNFPIEGRLVQHNFYFKVGDLSTVSSLLSLVSPDADKVAQSLNQQVANKWIVVDSTILDQDPTIKCLLNLNWTLSQSDLKLLQTQYKQNQFATIQSTSNDKVDGKAAKKFQLNISDDSANKYNDSLKNLSIVKGAEKCPGLSNGSAMRLTANKVSTSTTPLTVWVDKGSKRIVQLATNSNDTIAKVTIHYGHVSIAAPPNPIPVLQFLSTLEKSLGGDGAGLLDLLGSAGSLTPGSQAKASDSKRSSDIKSIQTHLEAFFSQNGYYPSRADMNSASWLSKNMKSLDQNALIDPSNPTQSKILAATPAAKVYSYQPTQSDGTSSCESDDTQCAKYTLTATYEGTVNGSSTDVVNNLD